MTSTRIVLDYDVASEMSAYQYEVLIAHHTRAKYHRLGSRMKSKISFRECTILHTKEIERERRYREG